MMNHVYDKTRKANLRRSALAVALSIGLGVTGVGMAQSTQGAIFGSVASGAGQTVTVTSQSGQSRTVSVGSDGRYSVGQLPVGTYTVTLKNSSGAVSTRGNVAISPGAGTEIDFNGTGANATTLGAVQVTANSLPRIDVTNTAASYVVTAAQLQKLPLAHSANAIALLAPGVVPASGFFNNAVTFAGAGATENAYYVNGYNTTALYDYTGPSYQLPYGSIAQQQTLVGGYGAKYGRADGGVISQIGKRGTNEWHFGAAITWKPRSLESDPDNFLYPSVKLDPGETYVNSKRAGDLRRYRKDNKSWSTEKAVYAGGPLVKDTLFVYVAVQRNESSSRSVQTVGTDTDIYSKSHSTNWYGKLDWNINDSNILEYTKLKVDERNAYGTTYTFDNDTKTDGTSLGGLAYGDFDNDTDIFHYTSYLSDAATLSILYGRTKVHNPTKVNNPVDAPQVLGTLNQNPALNGGVPIQGLQNIGTTSSPLSAQSSKGLRVDFTYQLGDHSLQAGIDNLTYTASNQGRVFSGPGYRWTYAKTDPNEDINPVLDVGAPGTPYVVVRSRFNTITSMSAEQKAWYVQDKWQVTPNLMVNLGLRNDDFSNNNAQGQAFVTENDQWEPRLGFTWDVYGDSSLKIYGTAGRYYLAIPQATGERAASGSYNTSEFFTYTGIDPNGIPTGLTPVPGVGGTAPPGEVSQNNEFGQAPDPLTVTATNLKPQYQDEFILGIDKTLGKNWVYGAKATYRTVGTVIDDECDYDVVKAKIISMGYDINDYAYKSPSCRIINPNLTADIKVTGLNGADSIIVPVTQKDFNFPNMQRDYYALDLYLEHPFDGTWMGKVSYTFARSWGNAEGQVRTDLGQTDVSVTEDWDYWQLMDHARGYLANSRRHQLKAYGAWQATPEWLFSGTLRVQSGMPQSCLGYFGPNKTNPGAAYGPNYHWCEGHPAPPGSQSSTPWIKQLDLGVVYRPAFAHHKLAFRFNVFNVFNSQVPLQTRALRMFSPNTVRTYYHGTLFAQTPRSMQLSVTYDY